MSTNAPTNQALPETKQMSNMNVAISMTFAIVLISSLIIFRYWPIWLFTPRAPNTGEFMKVFRINHDDTVTDLRTGLVWQREITERESGWRTNTNPPVDTCYAGTCDWRVPTIAELQKLHQGIDQIREAWAQQQFEEKSTFAGLARLCQSRSFLCLQNPIEDPDTVAPAPFYNVSDPVLARGVTESTILDDAGYVLTTWEMQAFDLSSGKVEDRQVAFYDGPPNPAFTGRCVVNCTNYTWAWLLVKAP